MKLTCVTATFNCVKAGNRERLIRCVESVAKLKTEHEHLIYDGASTDGTVELLLELEAKIPGLKVVSEPDTGIYNALNKGVRDAKGGWFYVLGADDYICAPEVLDDIMTRDELDRSSDVIVTTVRKQTKTGECDWFTDMSELNRIFVVPCVCHQGEVLKTSLVRELGGFDESFIRHQDYEFLCIFFVWRLCYKQFGFSTERTSSVSSNRIGIDKEKRAKVCERHSFVANKTPSSTFESSRCLYSTVFIQNA